MGGVEETKTNFRINLNIKTNDGDCNGDDSCDACRK